LLAQGAKVTSIEEKNVEQIKHHAFGESACPQVDGWYCRADQLLGADLVKILRFISC
jgi:hypothetical protein